MSHVQKWGNSLAVRVPKALADRVGWREGTEVELRVEDGKLFVERVVRPKRTLKEMLAACKLEDRPEVVDWGPDVGRERLP